MRKTIIGLSALLILSVGSCKKCIECTVYDSNDNIIRDSVKTCGNSNALEKARKDARDESSLLGGTYECTDPD
ncbi:MAG: hypothetical protein KDC13_02105 [Bacteroidetes bacterium]|nr:hypothetical protein [Bacteroidota bacterium]